MDAAVSFQPAVMRLGRLLKTDTPDAWLLRVMCWAKNYEPDTGRIVDSAQDVAEWVRWPFAVSLVDAFTDVGLLDAAGCLVGWVELNGWLVRRARKDRERHRAERPIRSSGSNGVGRSAGRPDGRTDARNPRGASAELPRPASAPGGALPVRKRKS